MTLVYCGMVLIYCVVGLVLSFQSGYQEHAIIPGIATQVLAIAFGIAAGFGALFGGSMTCSHAAYIKNDVTTRAEIRHRMSVQQTLQ